jgi:hypothetical protein
MGSCRVYQEHRRVLVGNPTTRNPLLTLNTVAIVGFVGFYGSVGTTNMKWEWEEGISRCGALEGLKACCKLRRGRTPGPSDVAEEWRRPCRARWGHDLYG